jgi:hypothetical protein
MAKTCGVVANLELYASFNPINHAAYHAALEFAQAYASLTGKDHWDTRLLTSSVASDIDDLKHELQMKGLSTDWIYNASDYTHECGGDKIGCLMHATANVMFFQDIAYADVLYCSLTTLLGISDWCVQQWFTTITRLKINGNLFCFYLDYSGEYGIEAERIIELLRLFEPLMDYAMYSREAFHLLLDKNELSDCFKYARAVGVKNMLISCEDSNIYWVDATKQQNMNKQTLINHGLTAKTDIALFGQFIAQELLQPVQLEEMSCESS